MLFRAFTFISLLVLMYPVTSRRHLHPLSDEFIKQINSKQSLWTAGRNFNRLTPVVYLRRLAGTIKSNRERTHTETNYNFEPPSLPENFDARDRWPHCPTLKAIRDQGGCSSSWAVAAVSAMTDQICIKSNGKKNFDLSADDVLSCCGCTCGNGCEGGILIEAWRYCKSVGIVTGGDYDSNQGCKPYQFKPCDRDDDSCKGTSDQPLKTPDCKKKCIKGYELKYKKDKHSCKAFFILNITESIQKHIFEHGPVTTSFDVYEDFYNYKNGIYTYTKGNFVNIQSVKLIGWGVENGVEYWLAANSWNTTWGDNGFFKIKRNINECGIEDIVVAGYVKL